MKDENFNDFCAQLLDYAGVNSQEEISKEQAIKFAYRVYLDLLYYREELIATESDYKRREAFKAEIAKRKDEPKGSYTWHSDLKGA